MWALPLNVYPKKGKMYKLMSQNLLKREITNKPKVEKFIFQNAASFR